jgi:drug/metabolite transporter (DMT)-like permease
MKPFIALLILSVLWVSSFLWTKELLLLFESPTIVFFRSVFGLAALVPFVWIQKKHLAKKQQVSLYFLLVVALGAAIPWTILGFASVVLLFVTSGHAPGSQFSIVHALLMFIITISYALNTILVKKNFSDIPALKLGGRESVKNTLSFFSDYKSLEPNLWDKGQVCTLIYS